MEHISEQLVHAISELEEVANAVTADEAPHMIDELTLEVFWREWPRIGSWAGSLWRRLNEDLGESAESPEDPELDEVGEGG